MEEAGMNWKPLYTRLSLTAFTLVVGLGCSGGGGSSTSNPPQPGTSLAVSGSAGLGTVQQGVVMAYEWKGGTWTQEGQGTTDATGQYSLSLSGYAGGSVKVALTGGSATQMVWNGPTGQGHTFGTAEAAPTGFTLATLLGPQTGTSVTGVPITPYTTAAAAMVEAAGDRSAAGITGAFAKMSALVGFDVASTAVKDLSKADAMTAATDSEQRAALFAGALGYIKGHTLPDTIQGLAQDAAQGVLGASNPLPAQDLLAAWRNALADPNMSAHLSSGAIVNAQLQTVLVDKAVKSGSLSLAVPTASTLAPLDAAKKLVSDTRSLANNIGGTDLSTPEQAIGVDVNSASSLVGRNTGAMFQTFQIGVEQALDALGSLASLRQALAANGTVTYPLTLTDQGRTLGTLTLTASNPSALKLTLAGTLPAIGPDSHDLTVDVELDSNLDLSALNPVKGPSGTSQTSFQADVRAMLDNTVVKVGIAGGTLSMDADLSAIDTAGLGIRSLSLTDLTLSLATADASFTGQGSVDFVPLVSGVNSQTSRIFATLGMRQPLSIAKLVLDGTFTAKGKTLSAELGFYLNDAATFDLWSFLTSKEETKVTLMDRVSADQIAAVANVVSGTVATLPTWTVSYGVNDDATTFGQIDAPDLPAPVTTDPALLLAAFDPTQMLRDDFDDQSDVTVSSRSVQITRNTDGSYSSQVEGSFQSNFTETSDSFAKMTFYANFELDSIPGIPDSKVSLVVNRDALTGGSAAFALRWDTNQYTFSFTDLDLARKTGTLTINNNQGVSLQLKNLNTDTLSGELYVGTTKVGDIAAVSGQGIKITYSDGSFETLQ
jgi:hypothetical protein